MRLIGLLMLAVCLITSISRGKEDAVDEQGMTRSAANQNDGTKGIVIEVDTAWEGETHIGF